MSQSLINSYREITVDICNLGRERAKLLAKQTKKLLNDEEDMRLFEIDQTMKTLREQQQELKSSVDKDAQIESQSFGTADRAWIEAVTGIDADSRPWNRFSGEFPNGYLLDDSIQPRDGFQQKFEEIARAFHMTTEAGRRIFLNLFLSDIILRPEFDILRIYPEIEITVETLDEGLKKRKLGGKTDYTVGFAKHISFYGEEGQLSIFDKAPPRELHLLAMEAKTTFDIADFWQCVAETAALYKARVDANKSKKSVWGVLSNANCWKFLQIDERGLLWQSKNWDINLEKYEEEDILPVYRFIYFVVQKCCEACTPSPSLNS